jgi:hypothetical protein
MAVMSVSVVTLAGGCCSTWIWSMARIPPKCSTKEATDISPTQLTKKWRGLCKLDVEAEAKT